MKWLGIGTGRCGTKSLVAWANAEGCVTSHESTRLAYEGEDVTTLASMARRMAFAASEVNFSWTNHWERARELDPDLPIIVLHRDKFDTVASHIRICGGKDRLVEGRMKGPLSKAYPTLKDKRDPWLAWGYWWDLVEERTADIPQPVWHMEMDDLNNPEELAHLRRWLQKHGRWA